MLPPQSESVSEEDIDPDKLRGIRNAKNLGTLQSIAESLQTYQQQTFELLLKLQVTRLKIPPRCYNNDNQFRGSLGIQRTMTLIGLVETSGNRKPKGFLKIHVITSEKMMMCKQAEHGVPLQAEQADWLADTDEEIDEQELEAHYSFMAKI
ncbi:hypothetical protein Tco_0888641 [Tanacetum coccineum]